MTTNASSSQGTQSPSRTYHVRWVEDRMVLRRIPVRNSPSDAVTRPDGSLTARALDVASVSAAA